MYLVSGLVSSSLPGGRSWLVFLTSYHNSRISSFFPPFLPVSPWKHRQTSLRRSYCLWACRNNCISGDALWGVIRQIMRKHRTRGRICMCRYICICLYEHVNIHMNTRICIHVWAAICITMLLDVEFMFASLHESMNMHVFSQICLPLNVGGDMTNKVLELLT